MQKKSREERSSDKVAEAFIGDSDCMTHEAIPYAQEQRHEVRWRQELKVDSNANGLTLIAEGTACASG